jgi:hypothetical protein
MSKLNYLGTLILGVALALAPSLQARSCSGNGDAIGGYGWAGGRSSDFVPLATTAVTPVGGSTTRLGALAAGAANTAAFSSVGRMFLDGNGFMFASAAAGGGLAQVGTYLVNSDCTISATITDAFAQPGAAGLTPVQASVTFEGVVVQSATEINLVQTGNGSSGAVLTLRRTRQFNSCGNDSLTGTFGLSGVGVATAAPAPGAPPVASAFTLSGRINADGNGFLVQDSLGLTSPLTKRQFTGTYLVNSDCTGTATLIGSDAKARKIDFVIVSPVVSNPANALPLLSFAFTDAGVVGSGLAQQQ